MSFSIRLSQCRIEGTGIVGTRKVPLPSDGEKIYKVPEQEQFLFQEIRNQIYKVLEPLLHLTELFKRNDTETFCL